MRFSGKKIKNFCVIIMTLVVLFCLTAASAVQASALCADVSVGGFSKALTNAYVSDSLLGLLIFIIVFLVLALVAVVVVMLVLLNKKKGDNNVPNAAPSPAVNQGFHQAQPMNRPMNQPMNQPVNRPLNRPINPQPTLPQSEGGFTAPTFVDNRQFPIDGAGDTTVLGAGAAGFVLQRKNGGEKVTVNKPEFYIGKEKAKVDYCITNNNSISRRHARIKVRAGKCYISDLGSTNCTYINGTKLAPNQEVALIPGDKVKLSNEEFEYIG